MNKKFYSETRQYATEYQLFKFFVYNGIIKLIKNTRQKLTVI